MRFLKSLSFLALVGLVSTANAGLADGAAKFVGNITTSGQVRSDFGTYWNQITAENECKWASIEGTRGQYNFAGCKAAYNKAKENGWHFKFHALIWGSQYPNWLNNLNVADTKTAITQWFDKVKENFPDLEMIDVVNEAIRGQYKGEGLSEYHSCYSVYPKYNDKGEVRCANSTNKIVEALGGDNGQYDFITKAFEMARERWPKAILIYNDYNTIQWSREDGIKLIQTIKNNGAEIDAYGLQAHDLQKIGGGANGTGGGGSCYELENVKKALEQIWDGTKLPIFISEYDIASNDDTDQENCYKQQIAYFMENEHVAGITIWGYVYGRTWTSGGNSGIIKDNNGTITDRPAMTWLKQYLSTHTGVNTTGLATGITVEPVEQEPFKGSPFQITGTGRIEAEDFDIPGIGAGNNSYNDSESENKGESTYRKGTGVDIKDLANGGHVIGWNATGDWLEYTINVAEAGEYTLYAAVSGEGGRMSFSLDGEQIGEIIDVSKDDTVNNDEEEIDDDALYGDFYKVKTNVTLPAGKHILRMTVVQEWFDLDYFNFVKGANAPDNAPIGSEDVESIAGNLRMAPNTAGEFEVIDIHGARLGRVSAKSPENAIETIKASNMVKSSGIYFIRSRATGKIQSLRIAK